ncbi:PKD domain-containing protein [Natranaeroarchaeum sulfidigenes]|uniref:Cell surface protein n=1 Tax=Natranaeroarchaeum sulfidigenes TaxID=2784880 RepID=A0A897MRG3_9EURY|nr:PKD domain-containing protein [Natranaeroarchaeum sulfidigenes]QSG03144.1 Cell surface protein [Natranaeroarchaeum sulfidigenes]
MLVIVCGGIVHIAAGNSGDDVDPFAEAGLDQEAEVGQTVLLDGTGSWAPAGDIEEYRWVIETPDGATSAPTCSDCDRTEFVPEQTGEYAVEVIVTDEHGNTDTDTMYVTVGSESTFNVTISGDRTPTVGEQASYTGTVEAPQTSVDSVEWRLDGDVITPDGDADDDLKMTETFRSSGDYELELVVTDDTGQVTEDELAVRARNDSQSGSAVSVDGDQLVTGERPLEGEYQLAGADPEEVDSVRWYAGDEVIGTGTETTVEWEPGIHEFYATVEHDGESHRATFPDGEEVVADPAPEIELDVERNGTHISGTAVAADEFGSLDTVSVYIGDDEIALTTLDQGVDRTQHEETFSATLPDDGSETPIRAVAMDDREQVGTDSTQQGQPELVSAEFVNTPVDSYHERIDEDRYTAEHELVIDLNGADPDDVRKQLSLDHNADVMLLETMSSEYFAVNDQLVVDTLWAGEEPGNSLITIDAPFITEQTDSFRVEHSPPEVHVNIIDPGQDSHDRGYKLRVDPSGSFDPDGSELNFRVGDRDRLYHDTDEIGIEFNDAPKLVATDQDGYSTSYELDLYDFYAPEIEDVSEVSEGPYTSGDHVVFDVQTEEYQIAAPEYDLNTDLKIENGQGSVQFWRVVDPEPSANDTNDVARQDAVKYYTGQVAVEIDSFADGEHPGLRVSNTASSDGRSLRHSLPEIDGIMPTPRNVDVTDVEYTVNGFERERTATSPNERVSLERSGYQVVDSSTETEAVELEKRQVDTTYSTETRTFDRQSDRDGFVSTRNSWSDGGTDTTSRTVRETEWVESMGDSSGRYTGETRQVTKYPPQVSSPTTVTEYKFAVTAQETVDQYIAEQEIEETTTSWESIGSTDEVGSAYRRANSNHDIRVGSTTEESTWELSKFVYETKTVESYDDPARVQSTNATVSGNIAEKLPVSNARTMRYSKIDEFSVEASVSGLRSESELIEAATDPESELDPGCSSEYEEVC